jgi:hypothetical protein
MPTTPEPRSAAAVNAEIRRLWVSGVLSQADRAAYQRLLVEWAAAVEWETRDRGVAEAA